MGFGISSKAINNLFQILSGKNVQIRDGSIYPESARYSPAQHTGGQTLTSQAGMAMGKDLILYTRLKFETSTDYFNIEFYQNSTIQFTLSFGYDWTTSTKNGNAISVRDAINSTNVLIGNVNMYSAYVDVVAWYDKKWGYINIYCNNALVGSWKPAAGGANLGVVNVAIPKVGNTSVRLYTDYLYFASPLVTAIGDSITTGAILHAANPDQYAGVDNYQSSYPRYISDFLKTNGVRNFFVVNKGVNGDTSDQLKTRFNADVVATGCKYTFIHGGINDHTAINNTTTTTDNKKTMADSALSAGMLPVVLGVTPVNSTSGAPYTYSISLHTAEQTAYQFYDYIDLWYTIQDPALRNAGLTSLLADTVHPNINGYIKIAETITSKILVI